MSTKEISKPRLSYKIRWHVLLVHFPISLFGVAFGFQILHLFIAPTCLEMATNLVLAAGALAMNPTTWSGWNSWKRNYKAANTMLFQRKITTAFIMLGFSLIVTIFRFFFYGHFGEDIHNIEHWIYMASTTGLIFGAVIEGYYGGRLNHHF